VDSKTESLKDREFSAMLMGMNTSAGLKMENLKDRAKFQRKMGRPSLLNLRTDISTVKEL
jgi:hypothetical protein